MAHAGVAPLGAGGVHPSRTDGVAPALLVSGTAGSCPTGLRVVRGVAWVRHPTRIGGDGPDSWIHGVRTSVVSGSVGTLLLSVAAALAPTSEQACGEDSTP